ncbi:MAG: LamG domain-containing protein [Deltaproteobacteria bacterium]|nr:LamG domain-containing protein [Deltaproteobacteria bacterium]MBI3293193.1 LamG domain-containing protein [Deltaproteobacteria bacterium]
MTWKTIGKATALSTLMLVLAACSQRLIVSGSTSVGGGYASSYRYQFTDPSLYSFTNNMAGVFEGSILRSNSVPQGQVSQSDFAAVSATGMSWDGMAYSLASGFSTGSFQSRVFDAGNSVPWQTVTVKTTTPLGLLLPDNSALEKGFSQNAADMRNNILLLHMNEAAGTPIKDYSTKKQIVAVTGTQSASSGRFGFGSFFGGQSRSVSSTNDLIVVPNLVGVNPAAVTVEMWVKTTATNGSLFGLAVSEAGTNNGNSNFLTARDLSALQLRRGSATKNTGLSLSDGQWHHVAVTWSVVADVNTANVVFYKDGLPVYADSLPNAEFSFANPQYCLYVGQTAQEANGDGYKCQRTDNAIYAYSGNFQDVAVYNQALTPTEIMAHFQRAAASLTLGIQTCSTPNNCSTSYTTVPASGSATFNLPPATAGRSFQYELNLTRNSLTTPVRISSVEVGPTHYYAGAQVSPVKAITYQSLTGFNEYIGINNQGAIRYQLSGDGVNWYYFDGFRWAPAGASLANANTGAQMNAGIQVFGSAPGQVYFRAILNADGAGMSELLGVEFLGQILNQ